MTTFTAAPVSNFVMPAAGNANFIRLVFQASDNDQPFGFLGKPGLPQDYVPQGLIIDTRGVSTAPEAQVTVGGVLPFEITVPSGTYASYIVPAFANPVITVAGLEGTDELVLYAANFPLFPQQYGLPNVTLNFSATTGNFTDIKTDTIEVSQSITVPNATLGTQEPVPISQANSIYPAYLLSISELRALTADTTNSTILVSGYEKISDGGGGVFVLNTADTSSADNGGTIIVDAAGRRWYRIYSGPISVKWFGATGNGSTDDTTAIASALLVGGFIYFPPGTYIISKDLQISLPGSRITGAGINLTTIRALSTAVFTTALIDIVNSGVIIEELTVDGNYSAGSLSSDSYCGVSWHGVSNTTIQNLVVTNVPFNGIDIRVTTSTEITNTVSLNNILVTNVGWRGVNMASVQNLQASNVIVTSTGGACFQTDYFSEASGSTTACKNMNFVNCISDNEVANSYTLSGQTPGGFLFGIGAGTQNLTLSNCVFQNNTRFSGNTWDGIGIGQDATNISSGIVYDNCVVNNTNGYGIDVGPGTSCTNCTVFQATVCGIKIGLDVGTNLANCVISGNTIENTIPANNSCYGIFTSCATAGGSFADIVISNNIVADYRSTQLITAACYIEFNNITYTNVQILNNDFERVLNSNSFGWDETTIPSPSGIFCNGNKSPVATITSASQMDATFYQVLYLDFSAATTINEIANGGFGQTISLSAANGNATLSTSGSGNGSLSFSAGSKTLGTAGQAIAVKGATGQWGVVFP